MNASIMATLIILPPLMMHGQHQHHCDLVGIICLKQRRYFHQCTNTWLVVRLPRQAARGSLTGTLRRVPNYPPTAMLILVTFVSYVLYSFSQRGRLLTQSFMKTTELIFPRRRRHVDPSIYTRPMSRQGSISYLDTE